MRKPILNVLLIKKILLEIKFFLKSFLLFEIKVFFRFFLTLKSLNMAYFCQKLMFNYISSGHQEDNCLKHFELF